MRATESITAYGHPNIKGRHATTLEITKAADVTPKGDCIIAVAADKSMTDFSPTLKELIRRDSSKVLLSIEVCGLREEIRGNGDHRLPLTSKEEIVCRKSNFICERTLMVKANKAARDIDRRIIDALRDGQNEVNVEVIVES
jgi:hypothetical protein